MNLRRLRVARGISQDELALQAGIERAYVGHLERGAKNPTIVTLERLTDTLQAPIADLFRQPEPGDPEPRPLRAGRKKTS